MSQSTPTPDTTARTETADALTFTYTNWRGETAVRRVRAHTATFRFDATEWHPKPQWLMAAVDADKMEWRSFAVRDIVFASPQHPVAPDAYDAGLLGDYGGGDIEWWQSYIRLELARAHEFYASQWPSSDATDFWKQCFQAETRARIEAEERLSSPQHPVGVREADFLQRLRAANVRRDAEYRAKTSGEPLPILFRTTEFAGEVGELLNVVKKMERERLGWSGKRATRDMLLEEFGGVMATFDLLAMSLGVDLAEATAAEFNAVTDRLSLSTRLTAHPPAHDAPGAVTGDRLRSLFEEHNAELIAFAEKHGKSDFISAVWQSWQECAAALAALDPSPPLPADVRRLVIAAREVATLDNGTEKAFRELDQAAEAFASRVPWDQP